MTKLASIVFPNHFSLLKDESLLSPSSSTPNTSKFQHRALHEETDTFYSFTKSNMFSKQPHNISSQSSSSSASLTCHLNITNRSKPPPNLNKPISHAASMPAVATSPVNTEGSLTMSKDDPTERISKVEGNRRAWEDLQSNETEISPPVE